MTPLMTGDNLIGVWKMLSTTFVYADTGEPIPFYCGDKSTGLPPLPDDGSAVHHFLTAIAETDIR